MYNTLVLYNASSAGTATEGGIYYDTSSSVIKLYDGTNWFTVGTSTSGLTSAGGDNFRIQSSNLNNYYTLGTTTQSALSMMTLEATSTVAIPLTIRGYIGQTANLLQIHNVGGTEFFAIDAYSNASSSGVWDIEGLYVDGLATTTIDTGSIATEGGLIVNESAGNYDLRAESSNQSNMFLVDASADRVGIATTTPWATFSINTLTGVSPFVVGSSTATYFEIDNDGDLTVNTNDLVVDATNSRVGIGTSTPTATLSVGASAAATTTLDFGKPCFSWTTPAGTQLYYTPCTGDACPNNGFSGWATSTVSCNVNN